MPAGLRVLRVLRGRRHAVLEPPALRCAQCRFAGGLEDLDRGDLPVAQAHHPHDAGQHPLPGSPRLDAPEADHRISGAAQRHHGHRQLLPDGGHIAHVGPHAVMAAVGLGAVDRPGGGDRSQHELGAAVDEHARHIPAGKGVERLGDDGDRVLAGARRGPRLALASRRGARERRGATEQISLGQVHAHLLEQQQRGLVLDALGDRRLVELAGEADDPAHHAAVGLVGGELPDELDIDLEVVGREVLEVAEAAEAGAEVVERHATAQLAHPLGKRAPDLGLAHERRLGDLHDQQRRIHP